MNEPPSSSALNATLSTSRECSEGIDEDTDDDDDDDDVKAEGGREREGETVAQVKLQEGA